MSSSSVDGVCAMLNHACTILEQDFREVLFSKLRQGFPSGFDLTQAYNLVQSSITQGRLQSADVEAEKTRAAFLVGQQCFIALLLVVKEILGQVEFCLTLFCFIVRTLYFSNNTIFIAIEIRM